MDKKTAKKIAIGTVIAAAAGYIAGVLTAPKSGKETRQDIKTAAQQGWAEAEKQLKHLHTELGELLDQASDMVADLKGKAHEQLEAAMDAAKAAKAKTRELLSAVHEGDADDADLKHAIAEANKAVEHLKAYLKKG